MNNNSAIVEFDTIRLGHLIEALMYMAERTDLGEDSAELNASMLYLLMDLQDDLLKAQDRDFEEEEKVRKYGEK